MPSITKQRQLDLVSSRIELTGGRYSTRKLGSDIRNLQKFVGTKAQRRAIGQASVDKAVDKIAGMGKKKKYSTKKFASDVRNVQSLIGTKSQRRAIGDAVTGKAVAKIAGMGVMLAGRGHKKTRLEKAMCS